MGDMLKLCKDEISSMNRSYLSPDSNNHYFVEKTADGPMEWLPSKEGER